MYYTQTGFNPVGLAIVLHNISWPFPGSTKSADKGARPASSTQVEYEARRKRSFSFHYDDSFVPPRKKYSVDGLAMHWALCGWSGTCNLPEYAQEDIDVRMRSLE